MSRIALMALLALVGCSSVSHVCDKAGVCLETWRDSGASSTVTASRLTDARGNPIKPALTAISGGIVTDLDPFASGVTTTAADAKTLGVW